jgi:hypothetical protein
MSMRRGSRNRGDKIIALLFVPTFGGTEGWRKGFATAMPDLDLRV